ARRAASVVSRVYSSARLPVRGVCQAGLPLAYRLQGFPANMPYATVRADERCAWHGQSLLVTDRNGECGESQPLSGFYFREARVLRTLRLELNGQRPWLCESALISPAELQ